MFSVKKLHQKKIYGFPLWVVGLVGLIILLVIYAFVKDFLDSRSLGTSSSDSDSSQYQFASSDPSSSSTPFPTSTTSGKATAKPSATTKASGTPSPSPSASNAPTSQPSASAAPTASPAPDKPKCTASSIAPTTGPAPHKVFLHGSGEAQGSSGLVGYQWDYDGNGSWDSDVKIDEVQHTYNTAGQYTPKYRILGSNDAWSDICTYPFTVTVTASN